VVCGVVYDPVLDECFVAERGEGATLNGARVRTSQCERVEQALIAASLPTDIPRGSPEINRFIEVMHQSQSIRRLGSAALNLCYLATGRLDAYWATCVQIWDVAAGQLIAAEAGATITRPDGTAFDLDRPQFVAAATPRLHSDLAELLRRAGARS
jgi:myo-inositol-1(or 4)-monophosphatase